LEWPKVRKPADFEMARDRLMVAETCGHFFSLFVQALHTLDSPRRRCGSETKRRIPIEVTKGELG